MKVADPQNLELSQNIGTSGVSFCVARIPETERLFYGNSDFKVYEIDWAEEKPKPVALLDEGHFSYVTGITWTGKTLVSGSYDGRLIWWDPENRKQLRAIPAHDKWIRNVVASPDGQTVASVSDDMLCKLWNAESGQLVKTLEGHERQTPHNYPSMLYAVAFSPDGKYLATGDKPGHIVVWETKTGKKLAELETPGMYTWDPKRRRHSIGGVRSLAFSPDSKLLAIGGIGEIGNIDHLNGPARVEIFDWKAGKRLHEVESTKFKGLVEQIVFHPQGDWFVIAGGDHGGFISFYDVDSAKELKEEKAPMHVHALAHNETFDRLYAVGHGKNVVWDLKAKESQEKKKEEKNNEKQNDQDKK